MQTAYVILPLANDPALIALQNELKAAAPDLEWVDPADFHITLAYSDVVADITPLMNGLPAAIQHFPINVKELGTFNNPGSSCLYARVEFDSALFVLQQSIATIFEAAGAPLSSYSQTQAWQPHITLAYAPPDQTFLVPTWAGDLYLTAEAIELCVESENGFVSLYHSTKARRKALSRPLPPPPQALRIWKSFDGRYHWSAFSSVNAWDRDDEIVTQKALREDVERTAQGVDSSNLRFFHIPFQIGGAPDFRAVVDGILVETGTFDATEEAEQTARFIMAHPKGTDGSGWGMSIGFYAVPEEGGVFNRIRIYERSILPLSRAANPFTKLTVGES